MSGEVRAPARLLALTATDKRAARVRRQVAGLADITHPANRPWMLIETGDAAEFLHALDTRQADAAIIDVRNPTQLLKRARELAAFVPIIVITRKRKPAEHRALLEAGAAEFIPVAELNPLILERTLRFCTTASELEHRIEYLAQHDLLTGLPNRNLFLRQVSHALLAADRHGRSLGIASLEIDRFHDLAREFGQEAAETILRTAGRRLARTLRRSDLVARAHDEEFLLMLECSPDLSDLAGAAEKILEALHEPFDLEGRTLRMTASMGIAVYPRSHVDENGLLSRAREALQRAEDAGGNDFRLFDAELEEVSRQRVEMERELPGALARGEFRLRYQPRVDTGSGEITGAEVLLRWESPVFGNVSPETFIPIAERSGAIRRIGDWVLGEALGRARQWYDQGYEVCLGVNVAAAQLRTPRFAGMIAEHLERRQLPAAALELELTEREFVENVARNRSLFDALTELGVGLAVDDFGVGYSSLAYLKDFPIRTLKIDRAFVAGVPGDEDDASIVRAVIALGHALQLNVVAEGIENGEQLGFLRDAGCDEVQGYYVGRPLDAAEFGDLLRRGDVA